MVRTCGVFVIESGGVQRGGEIEWSNSARLTRTVLLYHNCATGGPTIFLTAACRRSALKAAAFQMIIAVEELSYGRFAVCHIILPGQSDVFHLSGREMP